jgi:hypothetical protein
MSHFINPVEEDPKGVQSRGHVLPLRRWQTVRFDLSIHRRPLPAFPRQTVLTLYNFGSARARAGYAHLARSTRPAKESVPSIPGCRGVRFQIISRIKEAS